MNPTTTTKLCPQCGHSTINPHAPATCIEFLISDKTKLERTKDEPAKRLAQLLAAFEPVIALVLEQRPERKED